MKQQPIEVAVTFFYKRSTMSDFVAIAVGFLCGAWMKRNAGKLAHKLNLCFKLPHPKDCSCGGSSVVS